MTCCFFFFNDTATTEIYTLSLHDALPISLDFVELPPGEKAILSVTLPEAFLIVLDRKSTRLNSSHQIISYAVFCLKKKNSPTYIAQKHCRKVSARTNRSHTPQTPTWTQPQ